MFAVARWVEFDPRAKQGSDSFLVTAQVGRRREQARKDFFSEETKQKTFINDIQPPVHMGIQTQTVTENSFFGSFFQKRTAFLALDLLRR
ncbi:MAG TPA: hypothetical protein VMB71_04640 [Acetobacteraceae bacterium]|nr:hypothetical protein [Acetobacteraceae bacterium]